MTTIEAPAPATIAFLLNGEPVEVSTAGSRRLLDVLREDFGLTGAKEGCGEGECGACSVLLDGDVVVSCLIPVAQVAGRAVLTVEGLGLGDGTSDRTYDGTNDPTNDLDDLDSLQRAFHETGAVQCGMCMPGMLLAARAYLDRGGGRDEAGIREAIAGNLCRCTGYSKVIEAIAEASLSPAAGRPVRESPRRNASIA
jgi:carbon-monoxide dehydrogenase small subunit